MRYMLTAATICLVCTGALAAPQVVTENLTGTIGGAHTVDTRGYFGKAGTDLSGNPINIYTQYVPKLLGASQECRTHACTYNVSTQMPDTQGSLVVTLTVNGHRLAYSPSLKGAVFFSTQAPYALTIDSDAFSGFGLGLPGIQLYTAFSQAPVFGHPLSPADNPVAHSAAYVFFYDANNQTPDEELDFNVTNGTK